MAKPTAPLLSFGASGQIGKSLVFSKWRGQPYARRHVIPGNPQTAEQSLTRDTFSWLQAVWKQAPTLFQDPWASYANGKVLTDRNAFTKFNLPNLRDAADTALMVASPGSLGGLPPATFTVTPGNDQLTLACTAPAVLPVGWSVYAAEFALIASQEPGVGTSYQITCMEDLASAYSQVFTGLANAALYQCFAWLKWLRPDGRYAYSPSVTTTGLTT